MKVNVVIPMAGKGSRFSNAGYTLPKPLIDVAGLPMIERVLNNIDLPEASYKLVLQESQYNENKIFFKSLQNRFNIQYISINHITEGALMTVLYSHQSINYDTPLMIANSDQIVEIDFNKFLDDMISRNLDGSIMTFQSNEDKWSYIRLDGANVTQVKEKEVISEFATTGIYLFNSGKKFIDSALDMIVRNERVNNEFYVAPVYNYLIKNELKIGHFNVDSSSFFGIGTPKDLDTYLEYLNEKG